jgi:hypothetical protein
LVHLLNTSRMLQIDAASGCEVSWGRLDRIAVRSDLYRVRSRESTRGWGQTGINEAAGSKSVAGGTFWGRVVNSTVGMGRQRISVPVNVMVSVLDIILLEGDMLNDCTYLEQFTQILIMQKTI